MLSEGAAGSSGNPVLLSCTSVVQPSSTVMLEAGSKHFADQARGERAAEKVKGYLFESPTQCMRFVGSNVYCFSQDFASCCFLNNSSFWGVDVNMKI